MERVAPPVVGGKRPVLSPEVIRSLADVLRGGNYRTVAERVVGLPKGTVATWLKRSKRTLDRIQREKRDPTPQEKIELELLTEIVHAEAAVEAEAVANLQRIALQSPDQKLQLKATLELLARKFPARWGDKRSVTVEGGEKPLQHQHAHLHASVEVASTEDMLARMDLAFAPAEVIVAQIEAKEDEG